jgi:hypothetical protein
MKQLLFTILLTLTVQLSVFAQHDFGLKASGGLSYVATTDDGYYSINGKDYFQASAQAGLYYNLHIKSKFSFTTELLYSLVKSKRISETINYLDPNGPNNKATTKSAISYLAIPIYFGYNIKKLNINLGFQTAFELANSGVVEITDSNTGTITSAKIESYIKNMDFGARIGFNYQFSKRFAVEAIYYFGLINIAENKYVETTSKIQQILLGIRYNFVANASKKAKAATE